MAQARGKGGIFADYRIRVAKVLRDYTMTSGTNKAASS